MVAFWPHRLWTAHAAVIETFRLSSWRSPTRWEQQLEEPDEIEPLIRRRGCGMELALGVLQGIALGSRSFR
jgi:hypothetical protein